MIKPKVICQLSQKTIKLIVDHKNLRLAEMKCSMAVKLLAKRLTDIPNSSVMFTSSIDLLKYFKRSMTSSKFCSHLCT